MYGGIFEPEMGTYPPRVRRDSGVPPRGNSRRVRLTPSLAKGGRVRAPRSMGLGLRKLLHVSRFPRAFFFLSDCAKRRSCQVEGIYADSCIFDCIERGGGRLRPRLGVVVVELWKAEGVVWKACRFSEQHRQPLLLETSLRSRWRRQQMIHGDSNICGSIEFRDRRFRPRVVGAVEEVRKACRFS